ncbi:MAG: hypothetical protein ACI9YL_000049 [Luteibaculaceae bacterium]
MPIDKEVNYMMPTHSPLTPMVAKEKLGLFLSFISSKRCYLSLIVGLLCFLPQQELNAQSYYFVGGAGVTQSSASSGPNSAYNESRRMQFIYTAAELSALGVDCGEIQQFAFYVVQQNGIGTISNYRIRMANVAAADMNGGIVNPAGITTVWQGNYNDQANSWNNFNLATPFLWDGNNLFIEICWPLGSYSWTSAGTYKSYNLAGTTNDMAYDESDFDNSCNETSTFTRNYKPIGRLFIDDSNPLVAGSITPSGPLTICSGDQVTLNHSGGTWDTRTWEYSTDAGSIWSDAPGSPGGSYTTSAGAGPGTYLIRVKHAVDTHCDVIYSNVVEVKITGSTIQSISGSSPVCSGVSSTMTYGSGADSFQWQDSIPGHYWRNIPGATSGSYTLTPSYTKFYRVYADHGSCGAVGYSPAFELVVEDCSGNRTLTKCKGILTDPQGSTANYTVSQDFLTVIQPPGASTVTIDFTTFDMEPPLGALCYDYVRLYDGPDDTAPVIGGGAFCGTAGPGLVTSTGNALTVQFYSDNTTNDVGFIADYQANYPASTITINPATQEVNGCANASITVSNVPGATTIYWESSSDDANWSDEPSLSGSTITPAPSQDTYYRAVVIRDGGCIERTPSVFVEVIDGLASFTEDQTTICQGDQVSFSSTTEGHISVKWIFEGGTPATSTSENVNVTYNTAGTFDVSLVSFRACGQENDTLKKVDHITVNPDAIPGTVSAAATICAGESVTLNVSGYLGSIAWQSSIDNSTWANVGGANTASLNTGALNETTYFRVRVYNGCSSEFSNSVKITVNQNADGGTLSGLTEVCSGTSVTVALADHEGTLQWQDSLSGDPSWSNVGTNSLTYTTGGLTETTHIRVTVSTSECGKDTSAIHTITVIENPLAGNIGSDQTICDGENFTFTSNGTEGTLQWQDSVAGGSWNDINSETGVSYTASGTVNVTTYYRLVASVTNCGSNSSNVVALTVDPQPNAGDISGPADLCSGSSADIVISNTVGVIQWQDSAVGGSWANVGGATGTYTSVILTQKRFFRAIVNTANCGSDTSAAHEVAVIENPLAGNIGSDQTICDGESATYTSDGFEGTLQWQDSISGGSWSNIGGATNDNYTASGTVNQTTYYRLVASVNNCGSDNSNIVALTVDPQPDAGDISGDPSVCRGNATDITIANTVGTIQWQDSISGGPWSDVGAGGTTQNTGAISQDTYYRVIVSTLNCGNDTSATHEVLVVENPLAGNIGSDTTVCDGTPVTFVSDGTEGTLQWQDSISGGSWSDISSSTTDSYTSNGTVNQTTYLRLVATAPNCGTNISNEVAITVNPSPNSGVITGLKDACSGQTIDLTLTGSVGTIQWQDSTSGGSWSNVGTGTGSYTTGSLTQDLFLRVIVSTTFCGNDTTTVHDITVVNSPSAGNIGSDETICDGETFTFSSLSAEGGFLWQDSISGGAWTDITPSNSNSYSASGDVNNVTYYRLIASVINCGADTSNTVALTVDPAPDAGAISGPTEVCSGQTADILIENSVGVIQWQDSTAGNPWANVGGATGTYTSSALAEKTYFRVIVSTANCGKDTSSVHEVSIVANPLAGNIGGDQTICDGQSHTFTSNGTEGSLQWQDSISGGAWANLGGANADNYSGSGTVNQTIYFRLIASTTKCGKDTSNTVALTIDPNPDAGNISGPPEVCKGSTADIIIAGTEGVIQWQDSTAGNPWANVGGGTGTHTTPGLTEKTYFRVIVSTTNCGSDTSATHEVDVVANPVAGNIGTDKTICEGESHAFTSTGIEGELQWQDSIAGGSWTDISGAESDNYTASGAVNKTTYYRLVASVTNCGSDYSNEVALMVEPNPVAGDISGPSEVCFGTSAEIVLDNSLGSIQWQDSTVTGTWANVGSGSSPYTSGPLTEKTFFRAIVGTANCGSKTSAIHEVDIVSAPLAGNIGSDEIICDGESHKFTSDGAEGSLQWQDSIPGGSWNDINLETADNYTSSGTVNQTIHFRLIASVTNCGADISNEVALQVDPQPDGGDISGDNSVCSGQTADITINNTIGNIQWQDSTVGGSWSNVGSATNTHTSAALTQDTYFRVMATTDNCGSAYSAAHKVSVVENPDAGNIGSDQNVCKGDNITLVTDDFEGDLQWRISTNGGSSYSDIGGATNPSYTTGPINSDVHYQLYAEVAGCGSDLSNEVEITVLDKPEAGTLGAPMQVCSGSDFDLTLTGEFGNIQFQDSISSGNWANIFGATSEPYSITNLTVTAYYRAILSAGSCGKDTTLTHEVEVIENPEAGNIGQDTAICSGQSLTLSSNDAEGSLTWEKSTNSGSLWLPAGGSSASFSTGALTQTTVFRLVANVTNCGQDISNEVLVTVNDNPSSGTISGLTEVCSGGDGTLTLSGDVGNIRFQDSISGGSWANIIGANADSYTASNLTTSSYFRVIVGTPSCGNDTSLVHQIEVIENPSAGTIKKSQVICSGESVSLTTDDFEGILSWELSTNNGASYTPIANTNSDTYNTGSLTASTKFRLVATVANCGNDISNVVSIQVDENPNGGNITGPSEVCSGSSANLVLVGSVGAIQYQDSLDGGSWANISGANSASYITNNLTETTYFRTVLGTLNCGSDTSFLFEVEVIELPKAGNIGSNKTICLGDNVILESASTEGDLQWETSLDNGTTWNPISGANAAIFNAGAVPSTRLFRLKATVINCGTNLSNQVRITVNESPVAGTLTVDDKICSGSSITADLSGSVGDIQLQDSIAGAAWQNIASGTMVSTTLNNITRSRFYRVVMSTDFCGKDTSNVEGLEVIENPMVGNIGADQEICSGESVAIGTPTTEGDLIWEKSENSGSNWDLIPGENSDSLNSGSLTQETWFRLAANVIGCGQATSNLLKVTVNPLPEGGDLAAVTQVCSGEDVLLSLSNYFGAIQVQDSIDGGTWKNISGGISDAYTVLGLTKTTFYRANLTSPKCGSEWSNKIKISVIENPLAGDIGTDVEACAGDDVVLTTDEFEGSLQWEESVDNGNNWNDVNGANSSSLTLSNVSTGSHYRLVALVPSCGNDISNEIEVRVNDLPDVGTLDAPAKVCAGDQLVINVLNHVGNSRLQDSIPGGNWFNTTGGNVSTFTLNNYNFTRSYRVIVSTTYCGNDTSSVALVEAIEKPKVGNIGTNQTRCEGDSVFMKSDSPNVGDLQWEKSVNNGSTWQPIAGEATDTYNTSALSQSAYYRLVASVPDCGFRVSNVVKVTVNEVPITGVLTGPAEICLGETIDLSISGHQGSVQIQDSISGGMWAATPNGLGTAVSIPNASQTKFYRASIFTQFCGGVYSNEMEVVVNQLPNAGNIGNNTFLCIGDDKLLKTTTTFGDLMWQKGTNGTSFTTVGGETDDSLSTGVLSETTYFRLIAEDAKCGFDTSNVVEVVAEGNYVAGSIAGPDEICEKDGLQLMLSGHEGRIQYQDSVVGGNWSPASGSQNPNYYTATLNQNTHYRVRVGHPECPGVYTAEHFVTVNESPEAGQISLVNELCFGESTKIGVGTFKGDLQWEQRPFSGQWQEMAGANSDSLETGALFTTTLYRLRADLGDCSPDYSNIITVKVLPETKGGTLQGESPICYNSKAKVVLNGSSGSVVLQDSIAGGIWQDVQIGSTQYSSPLLLENRFYRAQVQVGNCDIQFSNEFEVEVLEETKAGSIPSESDYCAGGSASVIAVGSAGDLQWQEFVQGNWVDIPNENDVVLTIPQPFNGMRVRVKAGSEQCGYRYSDKSTLMEEKELVEGNIVGPDSICIGSDLNLFFQGDANLFTWEESNDEVVWTEIGTGVSYSEANVQETKFYRIIQQGKVCPEIESASHEVTVISLPVGGVLEEDQEICANTPFTLNLSGQSGDIQWHFKGSGTSWAVVNGESDPVLNVDGITETTTYRARVSEAGCGYENSTYQTVVIKSSPLLNRMIQGPDEICEGEATNLSTSIPKGAIQWESSLNGSSWSAVPGAITPQINTGVLTQSTYYRIVETSVECGSETSDAFVVTVNPKATAGTLPSDMLVCEGTVVTLSLSGSVGDVQWERSLNGNNWTELNGETATSLTSHTLISTVYYRVKAEESVCNTDFISEAIKVEVNPLPELGQISGDFTICEGTEGVFNVTGYEGDVHFQDSVPGGDWAAVAGGPGDVGITAPVISNHYIRVVSILNGCEAISPGKKITMVQSAKVSEVLGADSLCQSGNTILYADGVNATQRLWEKSFDGINWAVINGSTADSLIVTNFFQDTYFRFIAQVEDCTSDSAVHFMARKECTPPVAFFTMAQNGNRFTPDNLSQHETMWFWEFGNGATSFDELPVYDYPAIGVYQVCLTVENELAVDRYCDQVFINSSTTGVGSTAPLAELLEVYPNPTSGVLQVRAENVTILSMDLLDVAGRIIQSWKERSSIDVSNYSEGVYRLRITTDQGVYVETVMYKK